MVIILMIIISMSPFWIDLVLIIGPFYYFDFTLYYRNIPVERYDDRTFTLCLLNVFLI